jgi:hypothetical protein
VAGILKVTFFSPQFILALTATIGNHPPVANNATLQTALNTPVSGVLGASDSDGNPHHDRQLSSIPAAGSKMTTPHFDGTHGPVRDVQRKKHPSYSAYFVLCSPT